jgi:hypothetical protein
MRRIAENSSEVVNGDLGARSDHRLFQPVACICAVASHFRHRNLVLLTRIECLAKGRRSAEVRFLSLFLPYYLGLLAE